MTTTTSSATSMNFIGFDDMQGNGTPDILFNRVVNPAHATRNRGQVDPPARRVPPRTAAVPEAAGAGLEQAP